MSTCICRGFSADPNCPMLHPPRSPPMTADRPTVGYTFTSSKPWSKCSRAQLLEGLEMVIEQRDKALARLADVDTKAAAAKALEDAAEGWDEGYTSGHSNAMRRMSDEPNAPTTPNPYRAAAVRQEGT